MRKSFLDKRTHIQREDLRVLEELKRPLWLENSGREESRLKCVCGVEVVDSLGRWCPEDLKASHMG